MKYIEMDNMGTGETEMIEVVEIPLGLTYEDFISDIAWNVDTIDAHLEHDMDYTPVNFETNLD